MKANIHPNWNHQATVTCACGNTFQTGSTNDEIRVDICYACHPFYTGSMKFVDVQGRVDRFTKLRDAAKAKQAQVGNKKAAETKKAQPLSLKEMLEAEKSKIKTA
ncbi:50S ribosomal protein L31 [Candidatus Cerribacteria bacterium 'Amazon FNV 2010 28 9']|uniref:Large ribosomal subunit protein bL31 n=1 Tax=Candidatus Cerribacteria bacterium 'Amazon FNV 2010 28 9' TaxID=2081795 RepID=A0A317JPP7_9BACT|nr:MAG: 50S ribosomal protein L31 [Candidatus Cerribacteria bacterium 'Amazon FNV 2010 28 9']